MLKVGDNVPNFSGIDQHNNKVDFINFKNKKLIVFFYPKANTPGCTAQACDLRDHYAELYKSGYSIIGVSSDSVKRQLSFSNKFNFPFSLLADENRDVIDTFGVWGPKKFMGKEYEGINRITFIINKEGIIERVIDKVTTKNHASQIL